MQNEHGRIIADAAKAHLFPLGCRRKGQSRFWFSDQRFWLIGIEFQPSSWSKGSYLNVGVQWLWHAKSYFSYDSPLDDHASRLGRLIPYVDNEQFEQQAKRMAMRAAEEVQALRLKFSTLTTIADALALTARDRPWWPVFHAAVATGLTGDVEAAQYLFDRLMSEPVVTDWQAALNLEAGGLASSLGDRVTYRQAILDRVTESRALKRLQPDAAWLDHALPHRPVPQ